MDDNRASTSGSEQMPAPSPMFRPQEPKQLTQHIYQLYKPDKGEPTMEILFFHGLQFRHSPDPPHLSTWRTEDTSKEVWPGTWLAEEFPQAHIFSVSYDASTKTNREHGRLDLHNLAENLVQDITLVGIGQGFCRPVILVGHCFGGLAIKELLVQADHPHRSLGSGSERNKQIEKFLKNIGGVFFYGTPHHGSHLVDKAAYFLDGPLLHYVKSLSADSARLEQRFVSVRNKYNIHYIASIGESYKTSWGVFSDVVVPEASARYGIGDFYTVSADHISLCKPADKISSSFQRLIRFIRSIAPKVHGEACFEKIYPRVPKAAVGLGIRVESVREKLQSSKSVGIVGMGGIGKTTLARHLLNKLGPIYEFTCFVSVVKDITGTVEELKKEMWKHMQCGGRNIANPNEPNGLDWSELDGKKLLLVLDDAASDRDLQGWLDIVDDLASESRLVVTSRDKELLKNMDDLYPMSFLNENDAKQLFTSYAFPSKLVPPLPLEHHVHSIVKKCEGLPLTLEVLGSYLKGKENAQLWEETLRGLDNAEHIARLDEKLWAKLKLSYISLQEEEKQMFLDVTTFFSLEHWTLREAKAAWSVNYGFEQTRWRTLVDMSLVYDGEEDKPIKVHEQLQSLGRKLALDGKCIKLWETMQGWNLLLNPSTGITADKEIRSLPLILPPVDKLCNDYVWDIDHPQVMKSSLSRLTKVQYLDIYSNHKSWHNSPWAESPWSESERLARLSKKTQGRPGMLSFRDVLKEMLPTELVLLRSPTLQFGPILHDPTLLRHLAVLELELSADVKHLPSSIGQLSMLKILKIWAADVRRLPDEIGDLHQLERFFCCMFLEAVPETFGDLSNLKHLQFVGGELRTLPESFGQLCRLEYLSLSMMIEFQSLPESMGRLSHLKCLRLSLCDPLDTLPGSFGQWSNLEKLIIDDCEGMKVLPFSPGHLSALRHLAIVATPMVRIPDWVQTLPKLQVLEFG